MSMLLMVKAMQSKVGNPLRKLVLLKLADNANDQGECWPSYQYIADQCEMSKRSVMVHIEALIASGFLRKEHRIGGEKINKSNLYTLRIPSDGVVQEIHYPSAGDALGGSAGAAPRTSHSLEPVIEPLPDLKKSVSDGFLESLFEKFWNHYTTKQGKQKAKIKFKQFLKGKKEGQARFWMNLMLAYYTDCLEKQIAGYDKIHAATYINNKRWEDNPEFMAEFKASWIEQHAK
jgi:hypothetical protein